MAKLSGWATAPEFLLNVVPREEGKGDERKERTREQVDKE